MDRFIKKTVDRLRREHPAECAALVNPEADKATDSQPERKLVEQAISNAAEYRITGKLDLYRYCRLSLLYDLDFPRRRSWRWALPLLTDATLEPTAKLDFIDAEIERLQQDNPNWPN